MLRLTILALFGAIVWYGFDSLHVREGIFSVTGSKGLPIYLALFYFLGFFIVGLFFRFLERSVKSGRLSTKRLLFEIVAFLLVLLAHYLWYRTEILYMGIMLGYLLIRYFFFYERGDIRAVIFIAGLDLVCELLLIRFGIFSYSFAQWLPVPLWLAPMWGGLGLGVRRFYQFLMPYESHK